MNYYVFRLGYGDERVARDLMAGKLRQGWGAKGMGLDGGLEGFKKGWADKWEGGDLSKLDMSVVKRRFNNVSKMKDMEVGDLVVVPKFDKDVGVSRDGFTVVRVTEKYHFEPYEENDDFGHVVGVEVLFSRRYDGGDLPLRIKAKMRAYQSPVNNCYAEDFTGAVDALVREHESGNGIANLEERNIIEVLSEATEDAYLDGIVERLNKWSGRELERVVRELFVRNGHAVRRSNAFDGEGADVDLEVDAFAGGLAYELLAGGDEDGAGDALPSLCIQIKNKRGTDWNDIEGVNQLLLTKKNDPDKAATYVLINLVSEFSDEARRVADDNQVKLVDGRSFARVLARNGLMGEAG